MGKGKIAAQCGHATLASYQAAMLQTPKNVSAWEYFGQKKIALKVHSEVEMFTIAEECRLNKIPCYMVQDAGHTQVAPGSYTVLGIGPSSEAELNALARHS